MNKNPKTVENCKSIFSEIILVESKSSVHIHVHLIVVVVSTIVKSHVHLKPNIAGVFLVCVEGNVHVWSRNVHIQCGHAKIYIHLGIAIVVVIIEVISTDLDIHIRRRDVHIHIHCWNTHLDVCSRDEIRLRSVHFDIQGWDIHLNIHLRRC